MGLLLKLMIRYKNSIKINKMDSLQNYMQIIQTPNHLHPSPYHSFLLLTISFLNSTTKISHGFTFKLKLFYMIKEDDESNFVEFLMVLEKLFQNEE